MVASWFPYYETQCPDAALVAYDAMSDEEKESPRILIWIGMLLALEQAWHAVTLLTSARSRDLRISVTTTPRFRPPLLTIFLWVIFTSLSIVLVGVTFRSNAAVLSKTLHVSSEALFLMALSVAFGYTSVAGVIGVITILALLQAVTLPCDESIEFAARSGMLLDAFNFVAYAWYGMTLPNDPQLWTFIWGLGCHAVYLLTAMLVSRQHGAERTLVGLRILGVYANILASEFFLLICRREIGVSGGGRVSLKKWQVQRCDTSDDPLCVWTRGGIRLLANSGVGGSGAVKTIYPFRFGRTAYLPGARIHMLLAILPILGSAARCTSMEDGVTRVEFSILCGYFPSTAVTIPDIKRIDNNGLSGFVLAWWHVRMVKMLIAILMGTVLATVAP